MKKAKNQALPLIDNTTEFKASYTTGTQWKEAKVVHAQVRIRSSVSTTSRRALNHAAGRCD